MVTSGLEKKLEKKALSLGATEFGKSNRLHKKYYVVYDGKTIHFGDNRYEDYTTHRDKQRRKSYLSRAMGIRNKNGELTANNRTYPNFWAINILW